MLKNSKNLLNLLNKSASLNKRALSTTQRCLVGIDFNLNEEQLEFRAAARKFVDEVIIPNAPEWDQKNVIFL